ncbi:MAG: AmmeMemoRadiSam system protein B [Anaerolineae bacterium]|nr:AmmeMemoRadiSam system protein B [Anaerolineae bacterium]
MVQQASDMRPSPLAGTWYPARPDALNAMMDRFLQTAPAPTDSDKVVGLLAPHAGYRYSGPVAAHAFSLVKDQAFDTVVVIGPLHRPLPVNGSILTTAHSAYETPLGSVPVDQEALNAIHKLVPLTAVRNDPEHSVEIEVPFLQHVLKPGFTLVPIMLRDQSAPLAEALGGALAETLRDRRVLFVASSDLSHFYPQEVANQLDSTMLACVESMDADQVVELNETGQAFACGYGAIATVIHALQAWHADQSTVTGYATSGNVTGDFSSVVGYGAAKFVQAEK